MKHQLRCGRCEKPITGSIVMLDGSNRCYCLDCGRAIHDVANAAIFAVYGKFAGEQEVKAAVAGRKLRDALYLVKCSLCCQPLRGEDYDLYVVDELDKKVCLGCAKLNNLVTSASIDLFRKTYMKVKSPVPSTQSVPPENGYADDLTTGKPGGTQ